MERELCTVDVKTKIKIRLMGVICAFTMPISKAIGTAVRFAVKRSNFFIMLLSLAGCGHKMEAPKVVSIDSKLNDYVQDFVVAGASVHHPVVIDNLIVQFSSSLTAPTEAECFNSSTPRILVNSNIWFEFSEIEQEAIMFHELGHCILNLGHDTTMITLGGDYIPRSIMYPYSQSDQIYLDHWDYYVNELFNGP